MIFGKIISNVIYFKLKIAKYNDLEVKYEERTA